MQKLLPPHLFLIATIAISLSYLVFDIKYHIPYPYNVIFGLPLLIIGLSISIYYNMYFAKNSINIMTFN